MKSLKKIGVLSLGYVLAIIYAVVGFVQGCLLVISVNIPAMSTYLDPRVVEVFGAMGVLNLLMIPLITIIAAAGGFVAGAIVAAAYNFIAKYTGGIKIELHDHEQKK